MFRRFFAVAFLAFFVVACDNSITSESEMAPQLSKAPTVTNTNVWETWPLSWYTVCGAPPFATGIYDVHMQTQTKEWPDGRVEVNQHINSAGARLWDANGNEYVYQQVGRLQFTYPATPGVYSFTDTRRFMVISKGQGPNEFLWFTMVFNFDNGNISIEFYSDLNCRG